ncbi:MAG: DUF5777 family beta-barrel protein [Ekhidna sp.]
MRKIKLFLIGCFFSFGAFSQDELLDMLESEESQEEIFTIATFKGTRLINGHSVEIRQPGDLEFIIGHRFGTLNSGYKQFFGLDESNIRLALEYGIADNLNIGVGRSSFGKVLDAFLKYRILRQSNSIPVTVTAFTSIARETIEDPKFEEGLERNSYTAQILIARKFSSNLSLQLMPTVIQRNLVKTQKDDNLLIAVGVGGRYKLNQRLAINAEYYPQLSNYSNQFNNSFAIGVDIETGGHVFQLQLTNAVQMNEQGFIGETTDDFFKGDIHYGFNISRTFVLKH